MRAQRRASRALAAAGLAALVYMGLVEPSRLRVRRDTVSAGFEPLDVAVITDLHHGMGVVGDARVAEVVRVTNDLRPDVTVLLGDYHTDSWLSRAVTPDGTARLLGRLRARRGVYAVLGNHDHWRDAPSMARALTAAGLAVLENRGVTVPGTRTWLAGLADDFSDAPDPVAALRGAPLDAAVLAITHSPDVFPGLPARYRLTLAGHTHGGQVAPPWVGPLFIPSRYGTRYARGHYVEGGRHLYVSSGVGTSVLPLRLGVVPEVVLLRLR